jgi:hypothetical protein
MKVIIKGSWSNCVGTDYCDALGEFESLEAAKDEALDYAWDRWEPQDEDSGLEDDGPDYYVEEYNPEIHDMLRAGGGSFEDDFD